MKEMWKGKKIGILGFGKEGQSTFYFLRKQFPHQKIAVADMNQQLCDTFSHLSSVEWLLGNDYLSKIKSYDVIVKSPGVKLPEDFPLENIVSQTDIFFSMYYRQIIGITGTKGKSTTSSLIYHLIKQQTDNVILVGNIGIPPLDKVNDIDENTIIVQELSAHQLQHVTHSPHIAVLLNLYPEHLDFFANKQAYYQAKKNIFKFQQAGDILILNQDESLKGELQKDIDCLSTVIPFDVDDFKNIDFHDFKLIGKHNKLNAVAAVIAAKSVGITSEHIQQGLATFTGLKHRLQFVGTFCDVHFYNDSISTIPETTIQALQSIPNVDTLILGGFDRGLNYNHLYQFLSKTEVSNLIFTGISGKRMMKEYVGHQHIYFAKTMQDIISKALEITTKNKVCLLSPASASYDQYKNFEERGELFEQILKS